MKLLQWIRINLHINCNYGREKHFLNWEVHMLSWKLSHKKFRNRILCKPAGRFSNRCFEVKIWLVHFQKVTIVLDKIARYLASIWKTVWLFELGIDCMSSLAYFWSITSQFVRTHFIRRTLTVYSSIKTKLSGWKVFMFAPVKKMIKHFVHGFEKKDVRLNLNENSNGIKSK